MLQCGKDLATCKPGNKQNRYARCRLGLRLLNLWLSDWLCKVAGIKEFFKAANFNGENQMYCERCDAKADATIVSKVTPTGSKVKYRIS